LASGTPHVLKFKNAQKAVMMGMEVNPNYQGNLTRAHIENASTGVDENCAVRIHSIHPQASVWELLNTIKTGKIYSVNRLPPQLGLYPTAAADVKFLVHKAAREYINEASSKGIFIRGSRIRVCWNRNRVKPAADAVHKESRVLRFTGPEEKLSIQILEHLFGQYFKFELVDSKSWRSGRGWKTFELAFESIHPQASWARRVFNEHFVDTGASGEFKVCFGPDPCDNSAPAARQLRLESNWRSG
jgi:hypothetical protein